MRTIQRGDVYISDRKLVLVLQSGPEAIIVSALHRDRLLDQIHTVDRSRLGRYLCRLSDTKMNEVEHALHACLGLYYEGRAIV